MSEELKRKSTLHNSNQDKTTNNSKSLFLGDTWEATLNQKYSNEDKLDNVFLPGNYLYSHERDISFLSDNSLLKDLINKPFDLTESRIGCSYRDLKYKNFQLSSLYKNCEPLYIHIALYPLRMTYNRAGIFLKSSDMISGQCLFHMEKFY